MKINETGSNYSDYYPKERPKAEPHSKEFNLEELPKRFEDKLREEAGKVVENSPGANKNAERGIKS